MKNVSGVIAAGHEITAQAGEDILRAGGNAYDAILAAVTAACVAEPVLSSFGGAGFLLATPAQGKPQIYDFFAQTPGKKAAANDIDFYPIHADFGGTLQEFHIGRASCAVPGQIKGIFEIHKEYGSMPIKEIFAPAIHAAKKGVTMSAYQAYLFEVIQAVFKAGPCCMDVYGSQTKPGELAQEGEVITNPEFADFLEVLASEGPDLFYKGEVGHILDRDLREGGLIDREALASYEVIRRKPLELHYHDTYIEMNPPPAAGGVLISYGLEQFEALKGHDLKPGSEAYLRVLANILDQTLQNREALLADNAPSYRGTTHISVIDKDNNMASMTVSNGEGCGYMIPGTGIVMNNMLGEEDLNPGGFHRWQPNTRLSSMMSPTTVLWPDGRRMALGSGGSNRIRSAILQLLINLIDFDVPIEAAVDAPRIHLEENKLYIEGGFDNPLENLLQAYPNHDRWDDHNMFFGGTHVVGSDKNGFSGTGDPRRSGVCKVL